jgi:hypothetical protein
MHFFVLKGALNTAITPAGSSSLSHSPSPTHRGGTGFQFTRFTGGHHEENKQKVPFSRVEGELHSAFTPPGSSSPSHSPPILTGGDRISIYQVHRWAS